MVFFCVFFKLKLASITKASKLYLVYVLLYKSGSELSTSVNVEGLRPTDSESELSQLTEAQCSSLPGVRDPGPGSVRFDSQRFPDFGGAAISALPSPLN